MITINYLLSLSTVVVVASLLSCLAPSNIRAQEPTTPSAAPDRPATGEKLGEFVQQYCADCHNPSEKTGGLSLDDLLSRQLTSQLETSEKVVRKLRARHMPPIDAQRPSEAEYVSVLAEMEAELDVAYRRAPRPGRTESLRRLTRTEYKHAIRDLLAVDIDVETMLPPDDSSHGFDNITVGELSPTLLHRYVLAAQKISRLAIGGAQQSLVADTIRLRPDITQEEHVEGLPMGTRGGALVPYTFPADGDYEVQVRLTRDRNEEVEGLTESHELEILLDRQSQATIAVNPPRRKGHAQVDAHLKARFTVTAGPHQLGVTFVKKPSSLLETKRQPYQAHYNTHRHPRISPAVYEISITGPYASIAVGDTPSKRRIFVAKPASAEDQTRCAEQILQALMRRAYRRPVDQSDLEKPMAFFNAARGSGADFESAIEQSLSSILVNPHFLFRVEQDPSDVAPRTPYRISDLELASRLSFFLWSSLPDDELLDLATAGKLNQPAVLEQQVRRMLADERSNSLAENFASQWLYLRNLDSLTPDLRLFPDFDDNLRQAFRRETELLFECVVREDRSALDLLRADYTFLNARLAKHYGIPHIYGSRYRRVSLDPSSHRGGLLRHGSILTVTSYATRTSPVIRGHWILKNIMGLAPPPPPDDVPALKENTFVAELTVRQRLAEHRADAACASCHNLMDPVGFALENFDAIGRWRDVEFGEPVDASGGLPDGSVFSGVDGLEANLLKQPDVFVGTMVEKLLTFALGRGIEYNDAPAIRQILRDAQRDNYRLSSLVVGIASSPPFTMRTSP